MSPARRCEWNDLSLLLDDKGRTRYKRLTCAQRTAADRRIWFLADPAFSLRGNDRRAEHFARLTWNEIESASANGFGLRWADDLRELLIRFGRTRKWTQDWGASGRAGSPAAITGYEAEPNYHFMPAVPYDTALSAFRDSSWKLDGKTIREGYAPPYARAFASVHPQVARFRRGDSTLVVAAFDVGSDTLWNGGSLRSALCIATDDSSAPESVPRIINAAAGTLLSTFRSPIALASLELLAADSSAAWRWRSAIERISVPDSGYGMSDLLLFRGADEPVVDLEAALRSALPDSSVSRAAKLGVYWEIYGSPSADFTLPVSISFVPVSPALATKVFRSLGFGTPSKPLEIRWSESSSDGIVPGRSLVVDLSRIPPGDYDVMVELGDPVVARTSRRISMR